MDEATLHGRLLSGMRHFYGLLASASPGGRTVELDGVLAAIVPAVPERSVTNAVFYERAHALAEALPELASAYDDAGVDAWTVWVPRDDRRAAELLEQAGHKLDASPAAMGMALDSIERPAPGALEWWTGEGDPALVGALNDRSYEFGTDSFARAFSALRPGPVGIYVASFQGEPVCSLLASYHEGNCEIDGVATVPEARGRGLSARLLAHALVDAREGGCSTTTLVATKLGLPVYERLGYGTLGTLDMWERRS